MNAERFSELVRQQKGLLYRIARTMLHGDADAMDAVQEALLTAWKNRASLREEAAFRPWLARILVNVCNGMLRKRRPTLTLLETIPAPEAADTSLPDALELLDEELRLPVVLHYLDGFSLREIGQMISLNENAVKNRLYRARQKLRGLLEIKEVIG